MAKKKSSKKPAKKKNRKPVRASKPKAYVLTADHISVVEEPAVAYGSHSSSVTYLFSDEEHTQALKKAARLSSAKAIRDSKALGLSITYMEEGILYEESPTGKRKVLKKTKSKTKNTLAGIKLKKGMVLHVSKK